MKTLKKALALIMSLAILCSIPITASAAPVPEATIDTTKTGSLSLFKYDLTSAEKDGIWDSSYVSTGVKDEDGVEAILGNPSRVSSLNANGTAYGYAVPGVEFTYLKVADIHTYTKTEEGTTQTELLYQRWVHPVLFRDFCRTASLIHFFDDNLDLRCYTPRRSPSSAPVPPV